MVYQDVKVVATFIPASDLALTIFFSSAEVSEEAIGRANHRKIFYDMAKSRTLGGVEGFIA